ncbi:FAD-binding oxidoreductase [Methylophaga sp. 41_12_T18]|nr:FAD-binding oxidoreductase [Methylophaga sp. 41_12_T18]
MNDSLQPSPFHRGEQQLQSRSGVRDKMERFGRQVIRDYMPDQHRDFYNQLPFVFVGHADNNGWPWASILFNDAGFITSPTADTLTIDASPVEGDPLKQSLNNAKGENLRLGMMGVELSTRRRNRLAVHVTDHSDSKMQLQVDQAFGNCPQYIQQRKLEKISAAQQLPLETEALTKFDQQAQTLISNSDTFFVASYVAQGTGEKSDGVDVSHRGGKPGFIRIDNETTLTIPDYTGNNHFNTLGNFIINPKAGLLFVDFNTGNLLTLTGRVEVLLDSADTEYFAGAERLWTFTIEHGWWLKHALPYRWQLEQYSANTNLTGSWPEAEQLKQAEKMRNSWQAYDVVDVVEESSVIKSFHLKPQSGQSPRFKAGQFLTLQVRLNGQKDSRTYTVSSAPADKNYRISVKRELEQSINKVSVSNFLHDQVSVGDSLNIKAPTGNFTFDSKQARPAVLLSAGVGITPMISMLRYGLTEGLRHRKLRPITFIHVAKDHQQRAFFDEVNQLATNSSGLVTAYWLLTNTTKELKPGIDYHQQGRLNKEFLQAVLALDDYDFYLCGPVGFMQASYDLLTDLGVQDRRIYAESFGPASLVRTIEPNSTSSKQVGVAREAIIEFTNSKLEQSWSQNDGSLLEFAEAHGLQPEFSCRNGQCGACKVTIQSGSVVYPTAVTADVTENEALLCCAMPAVDNDNNVVKLALEL